MSMLLVLCFASGGCAADVAEKCASKSDNLDFWWYEVEGYSCVDGHVFMHSGGDAEVDGLHGLEVVAGSVSWVANQELRNLDGLGDLVSIGEGLWIQTHGKLTDIDGFDQLTTVNAVDPERGLDITTNPALLSISGFNSLTEPPKRLMIARNEALGSISGFRSLTTTGSLEISENASLTTLSGFDGLTHVTGSLSISGNPNLPTCEAQRLADRVVAAEVFIEGNNDSLTCDD